MAELSTAVLLQRIGMLMAESAEAAFVEEVLFRGLLLLGLLQWAHRQQSSHPLYVAVLGSSLIFGVLHLFPLPLGDSWTAVVVAQAVLKVIQGTAFGVVMAALVVRNPRFWSQGLARWGALGAPMIVHFLFDVGYLAPEVLVTGALPTTYLTGNPTDLLSLLITTILLVALAVLCRSAFQAGCLYERMESS